MELNMIYRLLTTSSGADLSTSSRALHLLQARTKRFDLFSFLPQLRFSIAQRAYGGSENEKEKRKKKEGSY